MTQRDIGVKRQLGSFADLVGSPDTVAAKMGEIMDGVGGDGFIISGPITVRTGKGEVPAAGSGAAGGRCNAGRTRQDLAEMPLAEDQHVIQALAAKRPHEPLRECVCLRRPDRVLITRVPLPEKTSSNVAVNLLSPVANQEPEPPGPIAEAREQVPGLLGGPGP